MGLIRNRGIDVFLPASISLAGFVIHNISGQTELREKIVNGSVTHVIHNIFGNDLVGTNTVTTTSSEKNYFLKDHLGSIKVIVNEDGSLSSYTDGVYPAKGGNPFGLQLENRYTVNNEERYKFTGKERDEETSYDYFGARYYDSRIARWLQVDPLSKKYPAWSGYNYTKDNPLRFVDPNGCEIKPQGLSSTKKWEAAKKEISKSAYGRELLKQVNSIGYDVPIKFGVDLANSPTGRITRGLTTTSFETIQKTNSKGELVSEEVKSAKADKIEINTEAKGANVGTVVEELYHVLQTKNDAEQLYDDQKTLKKDPASYDNLPTEIGAKEIKNNVMNEIEESNKKKKN
jgi:RHS repeat-associated protein